MIKVNELFAGIGAFRNALIRTNIPHSVVGISEIDKFAIKSYEAIYGNTKNYGDISKVDKLDYADLWTYGFPCQDISVAGKQAGINKHTRSGLLYEVERLLEKSKECGELPKYLMLENVKNLVGKKFKPQFEEWLQKLDELGFNTYWQVLNAKNYGVPQNRERVFAISIRKDIDTGYVFPEPFELKIRLKDVLEKEVEEKYYLSDKIQQRLKITDSTFTKNIIGTTIGQDCTRIGQRDLVYQEDCIMGALTATDYKQPKQILEPQVQQVGNIVHTGNWSNPQRGRIYSADGCSPSLNCCGGGGLEPKILTPKRTEYGKAIRKDYESGLIKESRHNMTEMQPREDGICNTLTTVQKDNYVLESMENNQEYINNISDDYKFTKSKCQEMFDSNGCLSEMFNPYNKAEVTEIAPTQTTMCGSSSSSATVLIKQPQFRIRKLTPKECWRLTGFTDEQFYKAEKVNSNSQLYKQAGNSIVVNVLEALLAQLPCIERRPRMIKHIQQWNE